MIQTRRHVTRRDKIRKTKRSRIAFRVIMVVIGIVLTVLGILAIFESLRLDSGV